ncbi:hypothetical protein LCGC14_1280020 [marine sediment metagenome]|uniref:Uncharacterized protein n=1 Tax=marine sediment metagenome TaxID=412755 RepID=A0A0F9KXB5_9ZZZZ
MAKPDLQNVVVTPAGELYRLDGKLGLELALNRLLTANGPLDAAASGVPVGGIYVEVVTSGLAIRLS